MTKFASIVGLALSIALVVCLSACTNLHSESTVAIRFINKHRPALENAYRNVNIEAFTWEIAAPDRGELSRGWYYHGYYLASTYRSRIQGQSLLVDPVLASRHFTFDDEQARRLIAFNRKYRFVLSRKQLESGLTPWGLEDVEKFVHFNTVPIVMGQEPIAYRSAQLNWLELDKCRDVLIRRFGESNEPEFPESMELRIQCVVELRAHEISVFLDKHRGYCVGIQGFNSIDSVDPTFRYVYDYSVDDNINGLPKLKCINYWIKDEHDRWELLRQTFFTRYEPSRDVDKSGTFLATYGFPEPTFKSSHSGWVWMSGAVLVGILCLWIARQIFRR